MAPACMFGLLFTVICIYLTQSKASVQLQVSSEESSQTAEQFATRLPSVQLVAAVDQTIGRGAVVSFVQNPHQQLTLTDHHLKIQYIKKQKMYQILYQPFFKFFNMKKHRLITQSWFKAATVSWHVEL